MVRFCYPPKAESFTYSSQNVLAIHSQRRYIGKSHFTLVDTISERCFKFQMFYPGLQANCYFEASTSTSVSDGSPDLTHLFTKVLDDDQRASQRSADLVTQIILEPTFGALVRSLRVFYPVKETTPQLAFQTGV